MVRKTGGRVIMALEVFCQIPSSWRGLEILFVTLNFIMLVSVLWIRWFVFVTRILT